MKVAVAHMAIPPFVEHVLVALDDEALLERFCAGLVVRDDDWSLRVARLLGAPGRRIEALLRRRRLGGPGAARMERHRVGEVLRLLVGRIDTRGVWTDRVWDWATRDFDRWSARRLPAGTAAYGYEYGCLALFQRAAALGVPRLYEIPSAEHDFVDALQRRELARFPELRGAWHDHTEARRDERTARRRDEFALSDVALCYSNHVVDSYAAAGLDTAKMRVVPLGAPPVTAPPHVDDEAKGPLRLLWAGTFGIRKGAHYLVEALEALPAGQVAIDIYGSFQLPAAWRQRVERHGTVHGPVDRATLYSAMRRAHGLVLPSLSDSFGMVVAEALAVGTPVLTTTTTGASMLLRDGVDGRVFSAADATALAEAIRWLDGQRPRLAELRAAAQAAAAAWQWPDFRRALVDAVRPQLERAA